MDAFALLTGGAKFDRRRYKKDIDAFNPKAVTTAAQQQAALAAARRAGGGSDGGGVAVHGGSRAGGGGGDGGGKKRSRKKRRRLAAGEEEEEEEDDVRPGGVEMFGSRGKRQEEEGGAGDSENEEDDDDQEEEQGGDDSAEGDEEDHENSEGSEEDTGQEEQEDEEEGGRRSEEEAAAAAADRRRGGSGDATTSGRRLADLGPLVDDVIPTVNTNDPYEEANLIRKALRIKVTGTDVPAPLKSFAELAARYRVSRRLVTSLLSSGFTSPTPIQRQAIPALLGGRELLAVAPTGSGKTLAFLVPILAGLRAARSRGEWPEGVKALVARVLKLLLPGTGLRGCLLTKSTAAGSDFSKVDVLLANPLRLVKMVEEGKVQLAQCRYVVLDEADKLFELGFMDQIDALLAAAQHRDVVRALFSATLPERVEDLARSVLQQPLRITVGLRNAAVSNVRQRLHFVGREAGKLLALRQLLADGGLVPPVLVFVGSKERAKALHRELMYDGVHVDSITAGQPQAARNAAVDNFRAGRTWVLIATDLIGRGMDFIGVNTVINYDFPRSTADYVHRIGRTGRAGRSGDAVTFFSEEDGPALRPIANQIKAAGGE
ncbi:hypothetical protein VOLCADRAFT_118300, partial [Volvox carteri f. nagariensis]